MEAAPLGRGVAEKRAEMRARYFTREEAGRLGWNVEHPDQGGHFLEEQEVVDYFPALSSALGRERPDFAAIGGDGKPRLVIECKSDSKRLDTALDEAIDYAETMSAVPGFDVRLAVGVAGSPDRRIYTRTRFRHNGTWKDLESFGFPLTQLPTPFETDIAIHRADGTTDVQLPDEREFFDSAISISNILRLAKIEEARRPVVIGSVILALWQGDLSLQRSTVLNQINANVQSAIDNFTDIRDQQRRQLEEVLSLGADAQGLKDHIEGVVHQLERLNIRSIMRSGVDFLGQFYETFLRYGCNTKNMGIVFTPRHITRLCAELVRVELGHTVYDPACGTGGFLVAAFDKMLQQAGTEDGRQNARSSIFGRDTNATVWALAMLNMLFRGDGKSRIEYRSALGGSAPRDRFQRVLMNPPFSQEGEPEIDFIDHALQSLAPGGIAAIVVKANVMVDPDLSTWRKDLVTKHYVLAVISLPPDLFYPTAASTVILIVRALARDQGRGTFLSVVRNDGFEISKKRRIRREGSQLTRLLSLFHNFLDGKNIELEPGFVAVVDRARIANGEEICAEQWLPSEPFTRDGYDMHRSSAFQQIALAVANFPDAVDACVRRYENQLIQHIDPPPSCHNLSDWFHIANGRSSGLKNYPGGGVPYVSSGDNFNSVVGMVEPPVNEVYKTPHFTITAFGHAALQPWAFCARGNGGSAVRVLRPIGRMSVAEMLWFIGQVNAQRWRFHYGRMATKGRLEKLGVVPPPVDLEPIGDVGARVKRFREDLARLSGDDNAASEFFMLANTWRMEADISSSARQLATHPAYLRIIGMGERALPLILEELRTTPDHWFVALHAITGASPVPEGARGRLREMADAWVAWGKENGFM